MRRGPFHFLRVLACGLLLSIAPGANAEVTATPDPLASALALASDLPQPIEDDLSSIPTIDLTNRPDDLWQRVRNGFSMPELHSPLVSERQAWYLNRPDALKRIFERSRRYLHHVVEELEKRGMPTELALLPIIESAYNPLAYSSARALGMWQFIPSTGKNYQLDQNAWVDRRRDIIASTNAALDYLQNIYEMHGDWHLALASYNWGENAVARAIAKNQAAGLPTDYLSLNMPGETRYYVPKLQAVKNIVADPALFGFDLAPIPNEPYFDTVAVSENMDVSVAAKLAEIPLAEFVALNPAYHRPMIPGKDPNPLVLPKEKVETFIANLERYEAEDKPLTAWQTHTLKKGEKLEAVAARHGLTVARLKQLNGITPRMKVGPGFSLLVPDRNAKPAALAVVAELPKAPGPPPPKARAPAKKKSAAPAKDRPARKAAPAPQKKPVAKKPVPQKKPEPKKRPPQR